MSPQHVSVCTYVQSKVGYHKLSGVRDAVDTPHSAPTYAECDAVVPFLDSHSMFDSSALSAGW
jgi:hypothetical protein